MIAGPHNARALRRWLVAFVLCAGAVFASLTAIHLAQQHLAREDARAIKAFGRAGDDLDLGVLHVALAGAPDSPWQRAQGLALIEQGIRDLARLSGDVALGESDADLRQALERLRAALRAESGAAVLADPRLASAIHAAHTQARAVEGALRARAASRDLWLGHAFAWTLAISLLLLMALASGFVRSVRARERAVAEVADRDARLEQTLASLFEGVLSFDESGAPTSANPAAERLLGRGLSQLQELHRQGLGWGAVDADGVPLALDARPAARVLATGEPAWMPTLSIPVPGQAPRLLEVNAVPIRETEAEKLVGVVVSMRDVSAERHAAHVLAEHQRQLEAEVRDRARPR